MKIFILVFLLYIFPYNKKEIIDISKKNSIEEYHPIDQDYKFWTEKKNFKKTFLDTKSFSIKKYYSHNFFKHDDFGSFYSNGQNLFIPINTEKISLFSKKMFLFKDPFFSCEKIQYFDVKTPTSEIFYSKNSFKEKISGFFFSQSPNENTNYSIEYRNLNHKNEPNFEKNQKIFLTTFSYQDKDNYSYKLWGHYILQKFDLKEEIIKKWNIRKNIFFDKKKFIYNRFYINFIQKIKENRNKSFFLKTYIEYEKYSKDHLIYYKKNKINHFHLKNGLFLIFNQKKFNLEIGSILDKIYYELFSINEYNTKIIPKNKYIKNFSIETKINYPINNIFKFHSNVKWMMDNFKKPTSLQGKIILNTFFLSKINFLTQLKIYKNTINSDFIPIYLLLKNKDCYNNQRKNMLLFNKEQTIDFSLFYDKNYHISFFISRLDHVFQNKTEEMEKFLYRKSLKLYSLKLTTIHDIWKFQLHNTFLYQKNNSDPFIFPIPNFLSRNTISYKDNYFNKALSMQTGFSIHYFSNFYYKKINYPFDLHSFSSEKECFPNKIGGNPFIDYFLNLKIYKTVFYLSIQNIGLNYISKNNKELFIKIGFLWNLFT
ncbi:putative porin [Blattabacterium cuenoti]|uniref:putative porin n=1 Tax=Blattabacterium cuenoti TaxID=1653831 RepID=UPI00163C54E2|nr:putative porin [Blattabacterium cuenoti]